jgi:hypothetical protein
MKWVTRNYVHYDRTASAWLIKRFVDREAEFSFVPWGREGERSADAIPFGIPGIDPTPHDAEGTTFQKLIKKYKLDDPVLNTMATVIAAGVDSVILGTQPAATDKLGQMALCLLALAGGIALIKATDLENLEASFVNYDAVYATFLMDRLLEGRRDLLPPARGDGGALRMETMRTMLKAAHPLGR